MQPNNINLQDAENNLRIAHDKLMQVQQTLDNRDLREQKLLGEALDAVNRVQKAIEPNTAYPT
jgi:hypothetical protein